MQWISSIKQQNVETYSGYKPKLQLQEAVRFEEVHYLLLWTFSLFAIKALH